MTMTEFSTFLAYVVVLVVLPVNIIVTLKLWVLHRARPDLEVLRERGIVATALTMVVALFSLVFLSNDLALPLLTIDQTRILTRLAMFALVFPAVFWLWVYRDR